MLQLKKEKKTTISTLDSAPITTVIGCDITITGDLEGTNPIKMDGKVKGNIICEKGIILGENGEVHGDINSENIIIYGKVFGNIIATELLLKNGGCINGDIKTKTIEIEMGGKYNGQLKMETEVVHPHQKQDQKTKPATIS